MIQAYHCRDTFGDFFKVQDTPVNFGPATTKKAEKLGMNIKNIQDAAKTGKLNALRADLPDNYIATDKVRQ